MSFDPLLPLYGELATVVRRGGRVYPAALESHGGSPLGLVKLTDRPLRIDPALRAGGQAHLQEVASRSPRMHDGRVLACVTMDGFPLVCAQGSYFDAIATSDSLRAEYLRHLAGSERSPTDLDALDLDALPLRRLAHEACVEDVLRGGQGRVAAVGVSVAVTVPAPRGRALVLGLRSHNLAADPDTWHVAPSGMLEPAGADPVVEMVERALSEEHLAPSGSPKSGAADPVIEVVERELREELGLRIGTSQELSARLTTLGIGYDLLRLRPEICMRLDVNEEEVPRQGLMLASDEFQAQRLVELSAQSMGEFWLSHPPQTLTPAAAATIALLEIVDGA